MWTSVLRFCRFCGMTATATEDRVLDIKERVERNVNTLCRWRGLTHVALYTKMGWTKQSFYNRLSGPTRLTLAHLDELARALEVEPELLLVHSLSDLDPTQKLKSPMRLAPYPDVTAEQLLLHFDLPPQLSLV